MGVSVGPTSKGGRKSVDAELNLIPFIDLLSVCILFLLMTAVWVQISKMSALTQPGGQNTVANSSVTQLNEERENRDWEVLVRTSGVQDMQNGRSLGTFSVEAAKARIAELNEQYLKSKTDVKISLRAADDVLYEDMIQVLDALFTQNLLDVSIAGI